MTANIKKTVSKKSQWLKIRSNIAYTTIYRTMEKTSMRYIEHIKYWKFLCWSWKCFWWGLFFEIFSRMNMWHTRATLKVACNNVIILVIQIIAAWKAVFFWGGGGKFWKRLFNELKSTNNRNAFKTLLNRCYHSTCNQPFWICDLSGLICLTRLLDFCILLCI